MDRVVFRVFLGGRCGRFWRFWRFLVFLFLSFFSYIWDGKRVV